MISVGAYRIMMTFTDFDNDVSILSGQEHIVNAIGEAFSPDIVSDDEVDTIKTITITNLEELYDD